MSQPITVTLADEPEDESDIAAVAKSDLKEILEPLLKAFKNQNVLMRDLVNAVEGVTRAIGDLR